MDEAKDRIQEKQLKEANDIIYEQLTFADNKSNFIFAASIALLAGVFAAFCSTLEYVNSWESISLKISFWTYLGYLIIFLSLSILFSSQAMFPRLTKNKSDPEGEKNLLFFGDVAKIQSLKEYDDLLNKSTHKKNLQNQNISVSKIIVRKHEKLSISFRFFMLAIIPLYIFVIIYKGFKSK